MYRRLLKILMMTTLMRVIGECEGQWVNTLAASLLSSCLRHLPCSSKYIHDHPDQYFFDMQHFFRHFFSMFSLHFFLEHLCRHFVLDTFFGTFFGTFFTIFWTPVGPNFQLWPQIKFEGSHYWYTFCILIKWKSKNVKI